MSLKAAIDNLKFDARMTDINFKSQLLSAEEHKKILEKLPDLKDQAMEIELDNQNDSTDSLD